MAVAKTSFDPTLKSADSRYADAGGLRTHYVQSGKGKPVILIHGGGPGADGWGNWFSCLPLFSENFHAIAVDMLGFGRTDKPDPASFVYSQDARTRHMIAFIESLALGPVTLIGNSMGGLTSLGVAAQRPDLVHRLILMGPAAIKFEMPPALVPLMNYDGTAEGMTRVIRALTYEGYVMDDALLQYRVQLANDPDAKRAHGASMQWIRQQHGLYAPEEQVRSVRVPTLVVSGKADPIVTPSQVFRILELIDNSWGYLIPHCGHWVMMERPQEFSAVCTRFILQ